MSWDISDTPARVRGGERPKRLATGPKGQSVVNHFHEACQAVRATRAAWIWRTLSMVSASPGRLSGR